MLLSTHNPQHALSFSNQVLALFDGCVAAFGETGQVLTPELIRLLYGIDAQFLHYDNNSVIIPLSKTQTEEKNK